LKVAFQYLVRIPDNFFQPLFTAKDHVGLGKVGTGRGTAPGITPRALEKTGGHGSAAGA
jgi:hypothetical protein